MSYYQTDEYISYFDEPLANAILELFDFETAVDIGCGKGEYVKAFNAAGRKAVGYDGSEHTRGIKNCKNLDLAMPVQIKSYDLVLSLEVGEHIEKEFEFIFLDNVCGAAKKLIILSWAVKGQPGIHHVNCQDNDYIIHLMKMRGWDVMTKPMKKLRKASTQPWFKNTLMVFGR